MCWQYSEPREGGKRGLRSRKAEDDLGEQNRKSMEAFMQQRDIFSDNWSE